jgi:putative hydrolase of the HAD superfamily
LGVASNFDSRLHAICRGLEPFTTCDNVFVSSHLGWRKPSPQFFLAIQQSLNVAPAEIVLVGDDIENDYRPALAAGWQAILLRRNQSQPLNKEPPVLTIRRLTDLAEILA